MKLADLLMIVLFLPMGYRGTYDALSTHSAALAIPATVIVTNATDIVNGDTSSMDALNANPGPDGISFREAINASNNTLGSKEIDFTPSLNGATIVFGSGGTTWGEMDLTSGQLTVNGDNDGDGNPDITLDGSLGANNAMGSGLSIWSDNNTIKGLNMVGFNSAVMISPLVPDPLQKVIVGNQIEANVITSTLPGSAGITVAEGGHIDWADFYKASDLLFQDTLIAGNAISVQSIGIGFIAGSIGASRNRIINTTIMNNHFIGGWGISVGAGDTASDFWGVPAPIHYSDNNLIDHVVITGNVLEGANISAGAANHGNRFNQVQHLQIDHNTITQTGEIILIAAGNGGKERSTSNNAMSDIVVDHNSITDALSFGILVGVGDTVDYNPDYPVAAGIENNQISGLQITNNTITNFHEAGIKIWGGCGVQGSLFSSNNLLDQLTITGNTITHQDPSGTHERTVGIELLAGESFGGPAQGNTIQAAVISSNTVSGNDLGISLIGGRGSGVQGNRIAMAEMQANDLAGNVVPMLIIDNAQEALGNFVDLPYKMYLPLVEHE